MPFGDGRSQWFPNEIRSTVRNRYNVFAEAMATLNASAVDNPDTIPGMVRINTAIAQYPRIEVRNDADNGWLNGYQRLRVPEQLQQSIVLRVSPAGSPAPANPYAGDPFDSPEAAFTWLKDKHLITPVTIQVAAGTYPIASPIEFTGVGQTVSLIGETITGTYPSVTNRGEPNLAADNTSNTTLLRNYYGVIFSFNDREGIIANPSSSLVIQNICLVNVGAGSTGLLTKTAEVTLNRVAICGFDNGINATQGSSLLCSGEVSVIGGSSCVLISTFSGIDVASDGFVLSGASIRCLQIQPGGSLRSEDNIPITTIGSGGAGIESYPGGGFSIRGELIVQNCDGRGITLAGSTCSAKTIRVTNTLIAGLAVDLSSGLSIGDLGANDPVLSASDGLFVFNSQINFPGSPVVRVWGQSFMSVIGNSAEVNCQRSGTGNLVRSEFRSTILLDVATTRLTIFEPSITTNVDRTASSRIFTA